MEKKPRIPTQKRALEKIDRIVAAAFKLFNEKGYYNTTTADIANEANVATGSVYAYFEDKKDIYIQIIRNINLSFVYPTHDYWVENKHQEFNNTEVCKRLFRTFIKLMISYHNFSKLFNDELDALTLLDKEVGELIRKQASLRIEKIKDIFIQLSIPFKSEEDLEIFLHYSYLLIDDCCHKIVYDSTIKDMNLYIDKCVDMIYSLFEATTEY
jgi:TetR/AcrR family transcriptional regulator, biofilm operon repressor